jgi:hypothetical protein
MVPGHHKWLARGFGGEGREPSNSVPSFSKIFRVNGIFAKQAFEKEIFS